MKLSDINEVKEKLPVKFAILFLCILLLVVYFQWGIDYIYVWASKTPDIENQQLLSQITSAKNEIINLPARIGH